MAIKIIESTDVELTEKTAFKQLSRHEREVLKRKGLIARKLNPGWVSFAAGKTPPGMKTTGSALVVLNACDYRNNAIHSSEKVSRSRGEYKKFVEIRRINMIKSKHWTTETDPQVDAFKRMSVLQRFLANDIEEGQMHDYEKVIVNSITGHSPDQIKKEIKRLETVAYAYK